MRTPILALAALLLGAAPCLAAPDAAVAIKDYMFAPMAITVPAGTRIVWTNQDATAHTVKSADPATPFASPPLEPGQSFAHVFATPGTYHILCGLHPYMRETITVQ